MLPHNRLGVHLIGNREADLRYIEELHPPAVKILDPDPEVVRRVLKALDPNGICILRIHEWSEQQAAMSLDPIKLGLKHANDWNTLLATGRLREFFGDKRIVVCGINEPSVHNAAEERIVFAYTKSFLEQLTFHRIRGLALNLSVGWPRNLGPNLPPIWDIFLPLEEIINRGSHFLCVHEYWYPFVNSSWGWYGNRIAACPMTVPIIIGECGYTRQLIGPNEPQPWGWQGNISGETYAKQLWEYATAVDPNVFAVLPFTTGFLSDHWKNKDTQPIHGQLVAMRKAYQWPTKWPIPKGTTVPPVEPVPSKTVKLLWPRMNRISQFYGPTHSGLDIPMVTGTPIYAMWDGTVKYSALDAVTPTNNGGYGNYIRINYDGLFFDGFTAHLEQRFALAGDKVKRGDLIGFSGNTGNSTGPHLHLEIRMKMEDGVTDRQGVGPFGRGQVDPLAVKWAYHGLFGSEEK